MKKTLLIITLLLACTFCIKAQTVSFTNPDIEVKFRRCICSGSSAYVDLVMTNYSGMDMTGVSLASEAMAGYESYVTVVYDDEGNVYKPHYGISSVSIGGDSFMPSLAGRNFLLPAEVPVKIRIYLKGVDEFATELTLLRMNFRQLDPGTDFGASLLEARNLPITRQ